MKAMTHKVPGDKHGLYSHSIRLAHRCLSPPYQQRWLAQMEGEMPDMKQQLIRRIKAIDGKLRKLKQLNGYEHIEPKPHPPASEAEISTYEAYLGVALPPSYRTFLSLYDGYEWLAYPGHILSIQDLMPNGKWHTAMLEWRRVSARCGAPEVARGIVIANMGQANNWVYLDASCRDAKTGDYRVVEWEPEETAEYDDLLAFLEECEKTIQYGLDEATGLAGGEDDDD